MSIKKFVNEFRNLPTSILILHVTSKFIGGVGIGMLISGYLPFSGWWVVLLSFIVAIPVLMNMFHLKIRFSKEPAKSKQHQKTGGKKGKGSLNLYVGNLSREVNEQDLRKAFEPFGKIASVKVIRDKTSGNSRGFGFVEMSVESEARTAMLSMNDRNLKGRKLNVNAAIPKSERPRGRKKRRHR